MPRLCQARRTLPTTDGHHQMVFTCNRPKGHESGGDGHAEDGRVRSRNGQVARYTFFWQDEGRELWRQEGNGVALLPDPSPEERRSMAEYSSEHAGQQ